MNPRIGHHSDKVAHVKQLKPINGKIVVLYLAVGSVVFTVVMGAGTYLFAKVLTPYLDHSGSKKPPVSAPVQP